MQQSFNQTIRDKLRCSCKINLRRKRGKKLIKLLIMSVHTLDGLGAAAHT